MMANIPKNNSTLYAKVGFNDRIWVVTINNIRLTLNAMFLRHKHHLIHIATTLDCATKFIYEQANQHHVDSQPL